MVEECPAWPYHFSCMMQMANEWFRSRLKHHFLSSHEWISSFKACSFPSGRCATWARTASTRVGPTHLPGWRGNNGWCTVRETSYGLRRAWQQDAMNLQCGQTIHHTGCKKDSILAVTGALSASRVRHILQLKARICKNSLTKQIHKGLNASVRCIVSHNINKRTLWSPHKSEIVLRNPSKGGHLG